MNLIAFPHYTCGGLLCDILNDQWSEVGSRGQIQNHYHSLGKIDQIDSDDVYDNYDVSLYDSFFRSAKDQVHDDVWISTHIWPDLLDKTIFNKIILVTTQTYRSKVYRWLRCCHHYYESSKPWLDARVDDETYVDKVRETAKNYLKPFKSLSGRHIINLEFSDIVERSPAFTNIVTSYDWIKHLDRWQGINEFLYDKDIWNSFYVKRFHEAEYELLTDSYYVYQ